jgi:hypothetical protein
VPEPEHPELPVRVQFPLIVLPFTNPESVSVLPEGDWDWTVIPNLPLTLPFKLPLRENDPLSVSDEKHGEFVVKLKLEIVNEPSALDCKFVANWKTVFCLPPTSVAFQVPFTLEGELFEPHPISATPSNNRTATLNHFIKVSPGLKSQGRG